MVLESSLLATGTNERCSPLPTSNAGPGILHPRSIATHVASLAQSMVSAPMGVLVQEHGLRIVSGVANRTASSACDMDRQERFGLRQLEQCKSITEVEGPASPEHGLST